MGDHGERVGSSRGSDSGPRPSLRGLHDCRNRHTATDWMVSASPSRQAGARGKLRAAVPRLRCRQFLLPRCGIWTSPRPWRHPGWSGPWRARPEPSDRPLATRLADQFDYVITSTRHARSALGSRPGMSRRPRRILRSVGGFRLAIAEGEKDVGVVFVGTRKNDATSFHERFVSKTALSFSPASPQKRLQGASRAAGSGGLARTAWPTATFSADYGAKD
jgi:hypothetical protein